LTLAETRRHTPGTPTASWKLRPDLGVGRTRHWYVYRGRNSYGVGSYGFASSGTETLSTARN